MDIEIGPSHCTTLARKRLSPVRFLLAVLIGLLGLMVPVSGAAHSGGLDKIGCHHDRKNGGYHCPRGPLAGQAFSSKEEALKALEKKQQEEEESKKAGANSKKD